MALAVASDARGQMSNATSSYTYPRSSLQYVRFGILYTAMKAQYKPLVWFYAEIKTPPFSPEARLEAGQLLRQLQRGHLLGLPHSRPMPIIGPRCHELRINDQGKTWRIFYRIDPDAIVIVEVLVKKTPTTPRPTIDLCVERLKRYDNDTK